ncbi:MAG: FAD-dependent oxidoreductase [Bacteroidetes bacterium]|nr:FAD-dependent oxidoreductase [Bacteroidota bacterium]
MKPLGTSDNPARIAIIGAGPAGFYAAGHLLKQKDTVVTIDVFDKLPVPYGLVRSGVAPDHQKIKNVTRVYEKIASHQGFRFYGNVEYGKHINLDDLSKHYHQVYFSTGAQVDRHLNIPGEDLKRSYSATDFVAWYNGHPDYTGLQFDLSKHCVAVVGVGNVAVDVCRILCRTIDELRQTDIADYALDALSESQVKEVYMLGRRGPAQAAFTHPEAKELGELSGADLFISEAEAQLDSHSEQWMNTHGDRLTAKKVELIQTLAQRSSSQKSRRLIIRFLTSPEILHDDGSGGIGSVTLRKNKLLPHEKGLRPKATDITEELPAQVVFRSVGYRGVPLSGLPFRDDWAVIPSDHGRVKGREVIVGVYVGGWIKRGPSGVIGTNKPDALETVKCMVEDIVAERCFTPQFTDPHSVERMLLDRCKNLFSWKDWTEIDRLETTRGLDQGRPRVKFTSTESMLRALGR